MFDDEPGHPRSKIYFQMRQLCRVFEGCVKETIRYIQSPHDTLISLFDWQRFPVYVEDCGKQLSLDWKELISPRVIKLNNVLDRIHAKSEEVESLQSSVSRPPFNGPIQNSPPTSC
jgi:hypothetical protein